MLIKMKTPMRPGYWLWMIMPTCGVILKVCWKKNTVYLPPATGWKRCTQLKVKNPLLF